MEINIRQRYLFRLRVIMARVIKKFVVPLILIGVAKFKSNGSNTEMIVQNTKLRIS